MQSFEALAQQFKQYFEVSHFPEHTPSLYQPADYFLSLGGKRIRPVLCLMGNELFEEISSDAWLAGTAIELFHNFTLIHDDIMDNAPLRRGMGTLHEKYGNSTALLAGDVMMVVAYNYLNKIKGKGFHKIVSLFNKTAMEVCEGQQLDMDFEKMETVSLQAYINMITLKTSVLLAASLQIGAILGGAGEGNQQHMYEFGRNLGIAFQVQDDYLDAFGDPEKFGKQVGGDIMSNKKTFLMIKALESNDEVSVKALKQILIENPTNKVEEVLKIYKTTGVDAWAMDLKNQYLNKAFQHLEEIAVLSGRKAPLQELASFLVQRAY